MFKSISLEAADSMSLSTGSRPTSELEGNEIVDRLAEEATGWKKHILPSEQVLVADDGPIAKD